MPQDHQDDTLIDAEDVRFLTAHLRGVKRARVRFLSATPAYELELIDVLLALGMSPTIEHIGTIAPHPKRRFGIRYKDDTAIITVAPDAALLG